MKLILQIISKGLELYNFYESKRYYIRAISKFYAVFNLSVAVLGIKLDKKEENLRNALWRRIAQKGTLTSNEFQGIKRLMSKDMEVITRAQNYIQKLDEDNPMFLGTYDQPDYVGVSMEELDY